MDPFVRALDAQCALLAVKNKELELLTTELAKAKAMIDIALPEKEKQIREATDKFTDLVKEYQEEVSEHRKARAELTKLKEVVARWVSQSFLLACGTPAVGFLSYFIYFYQ